MADRPLLMSAPMVRATLAGIKSQTRRILNPAPHLDHFASEQLEDFELRGFEAVEQPDGRHLVYRPRWRAGDRAWIRETLEKANGEAVGYPADGTWLPNEPWVWKRDTLPSIHMPRWASRLTLTVTEVRVQRLHDISEEDARAEGWPYADADPTRIPSGAKTARGWFQMLWGDLHGPESWDASPWVAAVSFTTTPANIDSLPVQAGGRAR